MIDRMIIDIKWLQGKVIQDPDQHGLTADKINVGQVLDQLCVAFLEEDEALQNYTAQHSAGGQA